MRSDDRVRRRQRVGVLANARRHVGCHAHPFGARDRLHLAARADEQVAGVLVLPERPDWQPRRAGEAGERREVDVLLPERHARVGHGLGRDARRREHVAQRRDARAVTSAGGSNASPNTIRWCVPVCSITPGAVIAVAMYAAPPSTRERPTTAATSAGLSTPFCSVSTIVPAPVERAAAAAAPCRCRTS